MKERKEYMDPDHLPQETEKFISSSKINWSRTKDEVWMELEKKIEVKSKVEVKSVVRTIGQVWIRVAVAAVFVLLAGIPALITLYTKTIVVPAGTHSEVYLPDKSLVKLNAQSTLKYKPLAWRFSRTMKFEGEAYFEIEKGKELGIRSARGKTVVLGTTFNIYSRSDEYQVTCFSGRVKVQENAGTQEVILNPGQKTALDTDGILTVESGIDTEQTLSWLNNRFSFTSVPLRNVFEEIGRQYGVLIEIQSDIENTYTGTFMKDSSVENVLVLVCRPFDLSFSRKADNGYIISGNK